MKRSMDVDAWPGYWSFPGGKIEDNELLSECAIRETSEEIGIVIEKSDIISESVIMHRGAYGVRLTYFALIENWTNSPAIRESHLADDLAWFSIDDLPSPLIPAHRE
jgi:8-oxo-dGTP diphosphatase